MSSGAWHYKKAEEILDLVREGEVELAKGSFKVSPRFLARSIADAQVHATLALAAATVEAGGLDTWEVEETGASGDTEWGKAVRS